MLPNNGALVDSAGARTVAVGGNVTLTGSNSFSGPLVLNAGALNFAAFYNIGSGTAVNFNGGTLQWATGNTLDITAARSVTLLAGGGTLDTGSNTVTFANPIGGPGGLAKAGAGTLILTSSNSYSGATTLTQGYLQLSDTSGYAVPGQLLGLQYSFAQGLHHGEQPVRARRGDVLHRHQR